MNKTAIAVIVVLLLGGLLIYYFNMRQSDSEALVATTTVNGTSGAQNSATGQNAPQAVNSIVLQDTESGNFVVVDSAQLLKQGYVVIYHANSNSQTDIVGHSDLLSVGVHKNLRIQLDSPIAKEQNVIAVLHEDNGDKKFEFPGPDLYLGNATSRFVSDVDIVDVAFNKEPAILDSQIEVYLDRALNASTTNQ